MKNPAFFLILLSGATLLAKSAGEVQEPSAIELQMACNRLHSAKNIRDEWELDFKHVREKWMEAKKIESAFESLEHCPEKSDSLHQAIMRTESLLAKEQVDAEEELGSFSSEGQKCKSKEKAERLQLTHNKLISRIQQFRNTSTEAAELYKKQIALSELLESVRKLPSEIHPKVEAMRQHLNGVTRAKQALQKALDEVVRLEKKYEGQRLALVEKYKNTKKSPPPPQTCDKGNAAEWIKEAEALPSKINEMIEYAVALKPSLVSLLTCKPVVDQALLEKIQDYPKKLSANVERSRGSYIVQRCLATAEFYDEVSRSVDDGEKAETNRRRMIEKEEDDFRRASSVPTLRKQKEGPDTASKGKGVR